MPTDATSPIIDTKAAFPTGRVLPHSLEAEEYLLSACLLDDGVTLTRASERGVRAEDFYDGRHGLIYQTLLEMAVAKVPVDAATLAQELQEHGKLEQVGGFPFITQVSGKTPTTAQAPYFLAKVKELAVLRDIIRAATLAAEDCYGYSGDLPGLVDDLKRRLDFTTSAVSGSKGRCPFTVWQPAAFRAYEPPPNLNILGAGYLRRRQLTTLIGPPGVGKTRISHWLAVCHICGHKFIDLDCCNGPAKWLFFGNESDPLRQKTDLDFFYRTLTSSEQQLVDANMFLHVLDQPEDGIITLADLEAYGKLVATLKVVQPDVIVFDPWGNMIEGNENDNEEVRRTLKLLLRAVRENCPDAAILVIHHARTGKSVAIEAGNNYSGGNLGRGSKVLVSNARCELALWPGHSEDASRLVFTCEKVNNVKKFEPKGLLFEHGIYVPDPEFDLQAWKDDIEGVRSTGKTLTIANLIELVQKGIVKRLDILDYCEQQFGVAERTVDRRIKDATAKGYLVSSEPRGSFAIGPAARKEAPPPVDRTEPKQPEEML